MSEVCCSARNNKERSSTLTSTISNSKRQLIWISLISLNLDATARFICDDLSMHIFRNKGKASCSIDLQVAPQANTASKETSGNKIMI